MLIRSRKIQERRDSSHNREELTPKKVEPNFMRPNFNTSFRPSVRPRSTSAGRNRKVLLQSRSNSASVLHRKRPRRPWIPPPGKATRAVERDRKAYPLCLVCDQMSKQRVISISHFYLQMWLCGRACYYWRVPGLNPDGGKELEIHLLVSFPRP